MTKRTNARSAERRTKRGRVRADLQLVAEVLVCIDRLSKSIGERFETERRVKDVLLVAQYRLSKIFKDVQSEWQSHR